MDKNEILEMSRNENKNGDEMQKNIVVKAGNLGKLVGIIVAIVFAIIEMALTKKVGAVSYVSLAIFKATICATDWYNFAKIKEKRFLIAGILETITAGIWFILAIREIIELSAII